ncbi:histidine phosphatase family protein [Gymnodinialimonas sp. 2305UL16-5]|uniref:histidine phosphatase family protein n=1 Tax=Gymnodinialimonas mytili TaxID=3126503 RepID=UPI003096D552
MNDLPPLYILRHGETEWNVVTRLQGRLDSPLTELGRAQALDQGRILAQASIMSTELRISPSGRAIKTAELALPDKMAEAVIDPRLVEVDLGAWQGCTPAQVAQMAPDLDMSDPHLWKFTSPGGESLSAMTERCRAVLAELTRPTILVTHGVTSRVLRCLALGRPPEALSAVAGGQGIVHFIAEGRAEILGLR